MKSSSLPVLLLVSIVLIIPVLAGCQTPITGTGSLTYWNFDFEDFTQIESDHGFTLDIARDQSFSINTTIDRALQEYFVVEQHGQVLRIGLKNGPDYQGITRSATIHLPSLRRLEVSGGCVVTVSGFNAGESIEFELSGGSALDASGMVTGNSRFSLSGESTVHGDFTMTDGDFNLSGGSKINLEGSAKGFSIDGSGGSIFFLDSLPAETADVTLSGASEASITVSTRLDWDLSGESHLEYSGDPLMRNVSISGGSTVTHR